MLTGLRRGLRGTEGAIGTQAAGDRFAVVAREEVVGIDLPPAAIGGTVRLLASGVGDTVGPAEAIVRVDGRSVVPPAPVHLTVRVGADGGRTLVWTRRSRAGWAWSDGVDVPIGEEAERYRATIESDGGGGRTVEVDRPYLALGGDERPGWATVVQLGTLGVSQPARVRLT